MQQEQKMNCMTVIVGKKVSATGRVLVAHNEDDPGHVIVRHHYVPASDHQPGEMIPAENGLAHLEQVPHTLGYYWAEYVADEGGLTSADAFANECGVVITSNSMGWSKEDDQDASVVTDGGIGFVLRRVLAERAHTAREGAEVLMNLMDTYGYAPSGRAYTIADQQEAFMFQLVRGKHYIGARVPDDAVVVMPNHYTFHTLHDCPEMFYSKDLVSYAKAKGWFVSKTEDDSDFDFAAAYQGEKTWKSSGNVLRQKHGQRIVLGRNWDLEKEGTPFCVYPTNKIDFKTLAKVMRCHYEGTEDDIDRFGPGHSPHNSALARRICTGTTLESNLWAFGDTPKDLCVYTALGRPCQVPYLPLHPLQGLPQCLQDSVSGEARMAQHLEKQIGATCTDAGVYQRFRKLCGQQEMLHADVVKSMSDVLDTILDEAMQENESVLKHGNAVAEDEAFLTAALEKLEGIANATFNRAEILQVSGLTLHHDPATITVAFTLKGTPVEDTLRFGLEYTHVIDAFSAVKAGSLRQKDGHWCADFDLEPLKKVLPFPGHHTFFLGGRTDDAKAFEGSLVCTVEA